MPQAEQAAGTPDHATDGSADSPAHDAADRTCRAAATGSPDLGAADDALRFGDAGEGQQDHQSGQTEDASASAHD